MGSEMCIRDRFPPSSYASQAGGGLRLDLYPATGARLTDFSVVSRCAVSPWHHHGDHGQGGQEGEEPTPSLALSSSQNRIKFSLQTPNITVSRTLTLTRRTLTT